MRKAIAKKPSVKRGKLSPSEAAKLLHDGVCQTLTAVQLLAKVLVRKMESEKSTSVPAARELNEMLQKAREELAAVLRRLGDDKPGD